MVIYYHIVAVPVPHGHYKSDLVFLRSGTDKHHYLKPWMLTTSQVHTVVKTICKVQAPSGGLGEVTADVVGQDTSDDID